MQPLLQCVWVKDDTPNFTDYLLFFFLFLLTDGVVVHKVLIQDNQYTLMCGNNAGVSVQWFYRQQQGDNPVNVNEIGDTSYIFSDHNLIITNIKPSHEGFYQCNQVPTESHLVVLGK